MPRPRNINCRWLVVGALLVLTGFCLGRVPLETHRADAAEEPDFRPQWQKTLDPLGLAYPKPLGLTREQLGGGDWRVQGRGPVVFTSSADGKTLYVWGFGDNVKLKPTAAPRMIHTARVSD